jgi:nickel-dependent lactate racemase
LRVKHEVLVLNVSDASPFVGARLEGNPRVADVDRSINLPKFMGKNSRVQREAGQHVRAQREETEAMLKRNGIVNVVVDSTADAIQRFALAVRKQQHLS